MVKSRILQVITDTDRRGAQVFALDLEDALTQRGLEVVTRALARGEMASPLAVRCLGPSRRSLATLRALHEAVEHADVVVGHGSTTLPACGLASIGTRTPFVYRSIGDLTHWVTTPARRLRVRLLLRRAAAVVALWPAAARMITDKFGVPPERVHVIPTGAPAARYTPADEDQRRLARRTFGLQPELPTIAYVGALSPEKNVIAAIRAVADIPDCQLLIVGDGPDRLTVEAQAQRLPQGRVVVHGAVSGPTLAYAAADVLVLPSISEGLPAVLIEAGLSGVPGVATDVGGIREVVVPGAGGELVPPGDTASLTRVLSTVLTDAPRYGERARAYCLERFDIDTVAAKWASLCRDIIGDC